MTNQTLVMPTYTEEDHQTWAMLYARQWEHVAPYACETWRQGMPALGLDPQRLPDPHMYSARLSRATGWTLSDAANAYLGPTEWFEALAQRRFPVTNYIRRLHELEFTPLPDLFHEYFGHLAFFTDPFFAETARLFGELYLSSSDERQHLEISRLWWFSTEFGLIREGTALKIYGAGLYSSPGEMLHAFEPTIPQYNFDIRQVAETPSAVYSYHPAYFVLDDPHHIRRIVYDYAAMENLPRPE